MATELFELKTRFDEQEKELKWAKREAESRERDFKVQQGIHRHQLLLYYIDQKGTFGMMQQGKALRFASGYCTVAGRYAHPSPSR